MKKIVIIIVSLFLLLSAVNFGTSKPILNNNSTSKMDYSIDSSIIDNAQEQQILQNINRLDGVFTVNRGQVGNDSVRYYIQGKGVWFLDDGVVFEIIEPIEETESYSGHIDKFHPEFNYNPVPRKSVVLKLNFEGCKKVTPIGRELLPHRSNFFYGNDPNKWCTEVPNYQQIYYPNIYNKIDLRYYTNENGLKYDFIVHPGGDPKAIQLNFDGADNLQVESTDKLIINTIMGSIVDSNLYIYQNQNKITGSFKLFDPTTYGFEILSEFDKTQDLIIDPIVYSTYFGGLEEDRGEDIEVDSNGSVYLTGYAISNNFPTTPGANDTEHNFWYDIFVLKFNFSNLSLNYSTFIGGSATDQGYDIKIDSDGNAYVTGVTTSWNYPTTPGVYDETKFGPSGDVFVLKLNSTGSTLIFSTLIGGNDGSDCGMGLAIDSDLNIYVTGYTYSSSTSGFPYTAGAHDTSFNGGGDVIVLKLNPTASSLLYSTFVGGTEDEIAYSIALDSNNNSIITGYTESSDFPKTSGAYDEIHNNLEDCFVLKIDSTLSNLQFSTFVGGNDDDQGRGLDIDTNGNVYVSGYTYSNDFPNTTGAYDNYLNGTNDGFVFKLSNTGSSLFYSTYIGGSNFDDSFDLQIDAEGNSFITGSTASTDFPNSTDAFDRSYNGGYDVYLLELDSTGSSVLYSTFIGGNLSDIGSSITIDNNKNILITGETYSLNFPITNNAFDDTHNNHRDAFLVNFSFNYLPSILDLNISESMTFRTNTVDLYSNATDIEDIESNLTPTFEYRDPNELVWNRTHFSAQEYKNARWEVSFTPPINAVLGLYEFRVRFNDTYPVHSDWFYLNDSLKVLNNFPVIEDVNLSNGSAILGDMILISINGTDVEEPEENLTVELEYRDPNEQSWKTDVLFGPLYSYNRWTYSFNISFNALFGLYDFRARTNDSDGNYSDWFYKNDSLLIYNTPPIVIDTGLSQNSVFRTHSIFLDVNGTDFETPESMLNFYAQYKLNNGSYWYNLTGEYSNSINNWRAELITSTDSILGYYDFRIKFEDDKTLSSGLYYLNNSLEILNNLPMISEILDDIEVGFYPILIDLTEFENDIEDEAEALIWSVEETKTYDYLNSISIMDKINDTLRIEPLNNVTGSVDIELFLQDKDGGTVSKSDITINVNSMITKETPKVTLLSPLDGTTINTLNPKLAWDLDYEGNEIITYSIFIDEVPDPQTEIKSEHYETSYTIINDLEDGKTYYWKVIPSSGVCLSEPFRFTVLLSHQPIYKVNLTTEKNYIVIKQGETTYIEVAIKNEGNTEDIFELEYSSQKLYSFITLTEPIIQLNPEIIANSSLTLSIPENFKVGDYHIKITATSFSDGTIKDEVIINVEVLSKDFEPEYNVSIIISPDSIDIMQGHSISITLTISNNGNVGDDYKIRYESGDFTSSDIQLTESSLILIEGDMDNIMITIIVPEDMEPGEYTIRFIVESEMASDEAILTITVQDEDGEEPSYGIEDNIMMFASIGIIIIIVVLILLFLLIRKKKAKEEEAQAREEEQVSSSEEMPSEVPYEQPPPLETPPKQPPILEVRPQVPQPVVQPSIIQPTVTPTPAVVQPSTVEETVSDEELEE